MIKKLKLGDLLLENKVITHFELEKALAEQKKTGKKLGDVLIELGLIDETSLLLFLSKQLNLPFLELPFYKIKPEVIRELPEAIARRYRVIPIDRIKNAFLVAVADPTDVVAFDEVSKKLKKHLRLVVVREKDLLRVIDEVYRKTDEIASLAGELEQEIGEVSYKNEMDEEMGDAPIKKLLNSIFEDAIQVNASDIHIEPAENGMRIRQRVDGVLQEQVMKGQTLISAIVLRLKLMAKLNISERRLPQDGRFSIRVKDRKIDVRMATMPVRNGEAVVMRLLDQTQGVLRLDDLGMNHSMLEKFRYHLTRPHGMILVTGPTGSGKSTTLYAGLSEINTHDKKIITVEDPVEYSFDRINQVQVQSKIGLNFSNILRSALRHDPDVVMVGEIRDEETAQIALRAAMTGHLVLSTLHTNDALSGPARLIDMGIEPYLAASAIRLVMAQRLTKRVCQSCAENYIPNEREIKWLQAMDCQTENNPIFKKGRGCSQCGMRGYKGRIGVYEWIEITEELGDALREGDLKAFMLLAKKKTNFKSLTWHALAYAKKGLISLDEVLRLSVELMEE
ncbi:MAG: type II/IV secretion system protein [Proteobacteria bacterium]|nr:type II/IV secretion system protein [Pseudomonadota bacterium]